MLGHVDLSSSMRSNRSFSRHGPVPQQAGDAEAMQANGFGAGGAVRRVEVFCSWSAENEARSMALASTGLTGHPCRCAEHRGEALPRSSGRDCYHRLALWSTPRPTMAAAMDADLAIRRMRENFAMPG